MFTRNMNKTQDFIRKAKLVHKDENIDYSGVVYINNRTPVKLYDRDLKPNGTEYGEFWQTPYNHLRGQKHPLKRGKSISQSKRLSQEEVIRRFEEVHRGENLDYSQVEYVNMHTKVKIISHDLRPDGTEYGEFWQEPAVHLKGCTHPEIGKRKQILSQTDDTKSFIEKAKVLHCEHNYNYDFVKYIDTYTKVKIFCNKHDNKGNVHGIFEITPNNFLQGKGCPKCGNQVSKAEDDIIRFIKEKTSTIVEQRNRTILNGKELDIYLPQYKIAFEFNGLRWHGEQFAKDKNYHLSKKEECEKQGISLFHIFEDEYIFHKDVLFNKILGILQIDDALERIEVTKCCIKPINREIAKKFLENNHIQGYSKATVHLGAFYNEKLVSVMSLLRISNNEWKIMRFTDDIKFTLQDICGKFINYFEQNYYFNKITLFLDRRWENNDNINIYAKTGFIEECVLKPDFYYTNGHGKRLNKFSFCKQTLHKKYNLSMSMTKTEMLKELGYDRIWDCGFIKYVYYNPKCRK